MADVSHYNVLVGKKYCFNEIFAGNEYVVANIILIMSSGVEKRDIKGMIDNVSVTNIICIYIFNKHCDMDFLHRNILRYGFRARAILTPSFYHIWAWWPSWSCDLDHLYIHW